MHNGISRHGFTHSIVAYTANVIIHVDRRRKQCKMETLLLQTTNRKWYVAYRTATIPMTLSDFQGHSFIASLFAIFRTLVQQSTRFPLTIARCTVLQR